MITLSYRQPFPTLVALGIKPIENRTWKLPEKHKGKRVLIHASGKPWTWKQFCNYIEYLDNDDFELRKILKENNFNESWIKSLPVSGIIGSVIFTDCVINYPSIWAEKSNPLYCDGIKYVYNWICKDPILFKEPVLNVKGKLNFLDYKPENGMIPTQLIDHFLDNDIDKISL